MKLKKGPLQLLTVLAYQGPITCSYLLLVSEGTLGVRGRFTDTCRYNNVHKG